MNFPHGTVVKNPPAKQEMQENWIQSLGREDPLEWKIATLSSFLAGKFEGAEEDRREDKEAWWAVVCGVMENWAGLRDWHWHLDILFLYGLNILYIFCFRIKFQIVFLTTFLIAFIIFTK